MITQSLQGRSSIGITEQVIPFALSDDHRLHCLVKIPVRCKMAKLSISPFP